MVTVLSAGVNLAALRTGAANARGANRDSILATPDGEDGWRRRRGEGVVEDAVLVVVVLVVLVKSDSSDFFELRKLTRIPKVQQHRPDCLPLTSQHTLELNLYR